MTIRSWLGRSRKLAAGCAVALVAGLFLSGTGIAQAAAPYPYNFSPDDASATPVYRVPTYSEVYEMPWGPIKAYAAQDSFLHTQQPSCQHKDSAGYWITAQCAAAWASDVKTTTDNALTPYLSRSTNSGDPDLDEYKFTMWRVGQTRVTYRENTSSPGLVSWSQRFVGVYKILQPAFAAQNGDTSHGSLACVEANGSGPIGVGTPVQVYGCDPNTSNQDNQNWVLWPDGVHPDGYYVVNLASIKANPNAYIQDLPRISLTNSSVGTYLPVQESSVSLQSQGPGYTQAFSFPRLQTFDMDTWVRVVRDPNTSF